MSRFRFPPLLRSLQTQKHVVFWFSSRDVLICQDQRKKRVVLPEHSGFAAGQVADVEPAMATLTRICEQENVPIGQLFAAPHATVFLSAASSPLERKLARQVFQKVGFRKVSLVVYTTALRAFAERQAIRSGVGLYVGHDLSEGIVFTPTDQEWYSLDHSLVSAHQECQRSMRELHKIEVSSEAAGDLYAVLGKRTATTHLIRGRDIRTHQVETQSLKVKDLAQLAEIFEQKLSQELEILTTGSLFGAVNPDQWVVIGDALLNRLVQEQYGATTVFLSSELEMIQGVQWL